MLFICETINDLSTLKTGPIDPRNGWPIVHPMFKFECDNIDQAQEHFNKMFPKNVETVYPD